MPLDYTTNVNRTSGAAGAWFDPTIWTAEVIRLSIPMYRFRQFAKQVTADSTGGAFVVVKRNDISTAGGALTAGTKIPQNGFTISTTQFTPTEYGNSILLESLVMTLSPYDVSAEAADVLARDQVAVLDRAVQTVVAGNAIATAGTAQGALLGTNMFVTQTATSYATSGIATGVVTYYHVGAAVDTLLSQNAPKFMREGIGEGYVGIAHPRWLRGIKRDADFVNAARYGDPDRLFRGEVGYWEGVFWIESSAVQRIGNQYRTVIFGEGAFGEKVFVSPEIRADFAQSSANDLGRNGLIGWYAVMNWQNLFTNYIVGIDAQGLT